ncbi:MAG: hypothetical protein NT154_44700 [Verrucomicrobia bacterium]|nr:hypothetical protein [Verrucomicrobiota bacterium]
MPREKRDRIERLDELWNFLDQSRISEKNVGRLKNLIAQPDSEVQNLATFILDVARVHPYKRRRWRRLAVRHRDIVHRAVALLGPDFFGEVLMDYGDTGGPLWNVLEEFQQAPPWTASPCACGSGLSFRDCCMERENSWADEAAGASEQALPEHLSHGLCWP